MMNNIIDAVILNVKFKGEDILLPRIPMIPTDVSFEFKSLQFPVRNLENPCFSHGQLYVACSRVAKPSDLFEYTPEGNTKNIVYSKALQ
jgi:ATP-dependent DNA helicase PIF1